MSASELNYYFINVNFVYSAIYLPPHPPFHQRFVSLLRSPYDFSTSINNFGLFVSLIELFERLHNVVAFFILCVTIEWHLWLVGLVCFLHLHHASILAFTKSVWMAVAVFPLSLSYCLFIQFWLNQSLFVQTSNLPKDTSPLADKRSTLVNKLIND